MGPILAAYFPNAKPDVIRANNAIVEFIAAISGDTTPVAAGK
jgi:hypothetical protein